jgi:mannose/fructose/N-acetylgalactosamine-specific phosphotransferase system component IIC
MTTLDRGITAGSLIGLVLLGAMTIASHVDASPQAPTVTGIRIDLARLSSPATVAASTVIPIAQPTCNLAPTVLPPVTVNPLQVEWTDPALPTRVCRASIPVTLTALVPAEYQATAMFVYSDGSVGPASAASNPFTRFDAAIPQGLKLVK